MDTFPLLKTKERGIPSFGADLSLGIYLIHFSRNVNKESLY
ncbi:Hypothetical protein GL50581_2620 [Giardia duodenalis ATCC 50581]|uniref:Uncharacterized protein n=1 Tax=Giardia intestinalis (strain ATCC 50581 / GS clone H7) TaxID=598745 RepID=C6LV18_GIAIB|nr:Hypothetical protein GL50581_2620 [Giardia intestinalis ATCC 50581]